MKEAAKIEADQLASALAVGTPQPRSNRPDEKNRLTLSTLFDNHLREVTPEKAESTQAHDRRVLKLMLEILGPSKPAASLTIRDAQKFVAERRKRGDQRTGRKFGRPIGVRMLDYDIKTLKAVLTWAVRAELLERNPLASFHVDTSRHTPNRPVLLAPEYDAMLAKAGEVNPTFRLALILAYETGHRGKSLRLLRWSDISLDADRMDEAFIHWKSENDKQGNDHNAALSPEAAAALLEARDTKAKDCEWVLPSPTDSRKPVSRHTLKNWWLKAEKSANLQHVKQKAWHSTRRNFASKLLPNADLGTVQALGGWKSAQTLLRCYVRQDANQMRDAFSKRTRLEKLA